MNQHFVSQVLLKRFKRPGKALQRYRIETNEWKPRKPEKVFSARGWNQLRCFGQLDDSLEAAFSKVDTLLPDTLRFLDQAPNGKTSALPQGIHENLAQYCTFLWLTSPFAKAKAPADLIFQINHDLERQEFATLVELGFDDEIINRFVEAHRRGFHAILHSDDCLQLVYRFSSGNCTRCICAISFTGPNGRCANHRSLYRYQTSPWFNCTRGMMERPIIFYPLLPGCFSRRDAQ